MDFYLWVVFFFQAEDGIRDLTVTGVQTCALPILLSVIFGLKLIAQDGVATLPVVCIVAGVALGTAFVRRQLHLADPLIDLRLFQLPAFSASVATYGLAIVVLFGGFLFLPQYLQLVLGLTPFTAGLWTLPWAVAFVIGSLVTPAVVRHIRPVVAMAGGLAFGAIGFAIFTQVDMTTTPVLVAVGSFIYSLGFSPLFVLTNDLIIGSAPAERAGAASGVSETSAELGGALAIALFGSIGIAVYRPALAGALPPGILPESAGAARSTLGGALAVAEQLPAESGDALVRAARAAFLQGFRLCAAISTVGSVALAVFVAVLLRRVGIVDVDVARMDPSTTDRKSVV